MSIFDAHVSPWQWGEVWLGPPNTFSFARDCSNWYLSQWLLFLIFLCFVGFGPVGCVEGSILGKVWFLYEILGILCLLWACWKMIIIIQFKCPTSCNTIQVGMLFPLADISLKKTNNSIKLARKFVSMSSNLKPELLIWRCCIIAKTFFQLMKSTLMRFANWTLRVLSGEVNYPAFYNCIIHWAFLRTESR